MPLGPYSGAWQRRNAVPYSGAQVWGTGYNPVHEFYGSPNVRMDEIHGRAGDIIAPRGSVPEVLVGENLWDQTWNDSVDTGAVDYDGRPTWNEQPYQYRGDSDEHPPVGSPRIVKELFRGMKDGAHRYRQKLVDSLPTETVSEGWLNKAKGTEDAAKVSSPAQYEMQTSMQQRVRSRNNRNAVDRATDAERTDIPSRQVGQKLKVYSGGERHYDMFPRQIDDIPRPFYYRTAGTGPDYYLEANEQYRIFPMQRVPPPDPNPGPYETDLNDPTVYGYTPEDVQW